jgi:hypothetical protein
VSRRRHVAGWFAVVIAPSFARCSSPGCSMTLAGTRCWRWHEHGHVRYGCVLHCFQNARVLPEAAA